MSTAWDSLPTDEQRTLLGRMSPTALAAEFGKPAAFFERAKKLFVESLPRQTVDPTRREHHPPKELIVGARRDLSFYEANLELFDNSIDHWRKSGAKRDLHIEVTYDPELRWGKYKDDAGGMEEGDVYKVFIPGETSNRNFEQVVIGSFGMGAKKGIFKLSDGAKVVSCRRAEGGSFTSEVPEKWEKEPTWETRDGRAEAIEPGTTEIFFFKLFEPPTIEEINSLREQAGGVYAPLLRGTFLPHRVHIKVNGVDVVPGPDTNWSGAKGATPKVYRFAHVFKNFLQQGHDFKLDFEFKCGLTKRLPGSGAGAEPDWGIDVYGNGRLIEMYLKRPFFGRKGMPADDERMSENTAGTKYFRAQLFITGHSFAIPWDTHKREYLKNHEVARWLEKTLVPVIRKYVSLAGRFGAATDIRNTVLATTNPSGAAPIVDLPTDRPPPDDILPKWEYGPIQKGGRKGGKAAGGQGGAAGGTQGGGAGGGAAGGTATAQDEEGAEGLDEEDTGKVIAVDLPASDYEGLMERFGVDSEEELATAIRDCLMAGVAFALETDQLIKALETFKCDGDIGKLSGLIRAQLLKKLGFTEAE